jgi:hexosaminidase
MVDTGRRFFPMPLLENLLNTMAGAKLNVLHLHASDMCRFGVESKVFPNLTASLTGIHGGFYTQANITALIAYAGDLGIRVVPEFDLPGVSCVGARCVCCACAHCSL